MDIDQTDNLISHLEHCGDIADDGFAAVGTLLDTKGVIEAEEGELPASTSKMVEVAVESIRHMLGAPRGFALESFSGKQVSVESIKDHLVKVWETIKRVIDRIMSVMRDFWRKLLSDVSQLRLRATKITVGPVEFTLAREGVNETLARIFRVFSHNRKCGANETVEMLRRQANTATASLAYFEDVLKFSEDMLHKVVELEHRDHAVKFIEIEGYREGVQERIKEFSDKMHFTRITPPGGSESVLGSDKLPFGKMLAVTAQGSKIYSGSHFRMDEHPDRSDGVAESLDPSGRKAVAQAVIHSLNAFERDSSHFHQLTDRFSKLMKTIREMGEKMIKNPTATSTDRQLFQYLSTLMSVQSSAFNTFGRLFTSAKHSFAVALTYAEA